MVAGPNGSGKSTLLRDMRERQAFRVGQWLNPDEVQEMLELNGLVRFAPWKLRPTESSLKRIIASHPLHDRVQLPAIAVKNGVLHNQGGGPWIFRVDSV